MSRKLQHVIAYVTGGAHGIGKAVAEKILCQGGKVVLADISSKGAQLAESMGERALFTCTDVREEADVAASLQCATERFGGINVLVNSAAVYGCEPIYNFEAKKPHSEALYRCVFETNVWGLFNVTRLMAGVMANNKPDANKQRGVIINLASTVALDGPPKIVAYCATKGAVIGLTRPLARCLARQGIRVVAVSPGFMESPMTDHHSAEERKKWITTMLTPKRYGTCEEVADFIVACIENPLLNAVNLDINMGWRYCQMEDNPEVPDVKKGEKC